MEERDCVIIPDHLKKEAYKSFLNSFPNIELELPDLKMAKLDVDTHLDIYSDDSRPRQYHIKLRRYTSDKWGDSTTVHFYFGFVINTETKELVMGRYEVSHIFNDLTINTYQTTFFCRHKDSVILSELREHGYKENDFSDEERIEYLYWKFRDTLLELKYTEYYHSFSD